MTEGVLQPVVDEEPLVRRAAFRLLLTRGEPIAPEDLAEDVGMASDRLVEMLDGLAAAGRIRLDESGRVTGSAGLSVVPDRHEIELDGRRFWTWCAYDILGIFGALEATGSARSTSPTTGATIELRFTNGRPEPAEAVLFRPDLSLAACCDNVYLEWCPNSNLFEDAAAARSWSTDRQLEGQTLSLPEASELAASEWRLLVPGRGPHQ